MENFIAGSCTKTRLHASIISDSSNINTGPESSDTNNNDGLIYRHHIDC